MDNEENMYVPQLFSLISPVVDIFANFGWYILIFLVIAYYLYDKYIKVPLEKYKEQKSEQEYAAKYHKNPDLFSARLNAQEKRTSALQVEYDRVAEEYKRKQEEKELKKKQELQEKYAGSGHVLGSSSSKSFKPEYNPLMGHGSSSNYKPPKRSACSKGGCGG